MTAVCALCEILGEEPRAAQNTIGLQTVLPGLIARTLEPGVPSASEQHVLVHVCPEHVVDIYRGRVAGVTMAWRTAPAPLQG